MFGRMIFSIFKALFRLTEKVAPHFAVRWAARLFMTPGKVARPEHEHTFLESADVTDIDIKPFLNNELDKGRVRMYAWGTGPTVLLVHGWAGRGSQLGAFVPTLREHGFRVVSFDGFGHGNSSGKRTNLMDMAGIIHAVAEREDNLAAIVGHSFGGYSGAFALHEGVRADCLVTIGAPSCLDYVLGSFAAQVGASQKTVASLKSHLETLVGRPAREFSPLDFAAEMTVPLLSIQDRDDKEIDYRQSENLASVWPNSRSWITKGLGHRRILSDPDVHKAVIGFILEHHQAASAAGRQPEKNVDLKKAAG